MEVLEEQEVCRAGDGFQDLQDPPFPHIMEGL